MAIATCHTEGCENAGQPIDVGQLTKTDAETGEEYTLSVSCGVCGQPITDVVEPEPEPRERNDDGEG